VDLNRSQWKNLLYRQRSICLARGSLLFKSNLHLGTHARIKYNVVWLFITAIVERLEQLLVGAAAEKEMYNAKLALHKHFKVMRNPSIYLKPRLHDADSAWRLGVEPLRQTSTNILEDGDSTIFSLTYCQLVWNVCMKIQQATCATAKACVRVFLPIYHAESSCRIYTVYTRPNLDLNVPLVSSFRRRMTSSGAPFCTNNQIWPLKRKQKSNKQCTKRRVGHLLYPWRKCMFVHGGKRWISEWLQIMARKCMKEGENGMGYKWLMLRNKKMVNFRRTNICYGGHVLIRGLQLVWRVCHLCKFYNINGW